MVRKWMAATAAVLVLSAGAGAAWAAGVPANITQALADKSRPATEQARDAGRKPGELLAWAGVKSGDKVVDLVMGGGYFTRILSATVGPNGRVYAYQPAEFIQYQASYGESQKTVAAAYKNITPVAAPFGSMDLPDGLDLVLTVQNYHDLHLKPFAKDTATKANAEIFKSLKPGGAYVIVDHTAKAGSGLGPADTLHRIDPATVRQQAEAAGFEFAGESEVLRNPADPLTIAVFDPAIRGHTSQFAYKFRKPG